MPEGPSIVILKELTEPFTGKTVEHAGGNTKKVDFSRIKGRRITTFKSFGKNFFICFGDVSIRIHFMLFGTYRINEHKETPARLSLQFDDGELNFYACVVQVIDQPLDELYDWQADVMNPDWNPEKALAKLHAKPDMLACDALLDQQIFAGSGNIIKNEVLFRIRVHPESRLGAMPEEKLEELVTEVVNYSFDFLRWKKEFTLKKHWLAHTKTICPRDEVPFRKAVLGKTKRRSFYCEVCQVLYM
jgi:endonuclease VIII